MNNRTNVSRVYGYALLFFSVGVHAMTPRQGNDLPHGTDSTSAAVVYFNRIERLKLPVPTQVGQRLKSSFDRELDQLEARIQTLSMGSKRIDSFEGFRIEPLAPGEGRAMREMIRNELAQWSSRAERYLDASSKEQVLKRIAVLEQQLAAINIQA